MNLESLNGILELQGRSGQVPDHEDLFRATVKDFANQAYRTILCCYKDMTMQEYETLKAQNNDFKLETDRMVLE
jgi:magnesium-transporting ATPase (P-type)